MADEVNLSELLQVQVESVERPPTFPVGPYNAIVMSHELGKSSQKGTPFCRFFIKLLNPHEGVDEDLFDEAGGMEKLLTRKEMRLDFYLTPDAMYRLREFLEDTCQLSCSGRNFDVVIPEANNTEITIEIGHQAGQKEGEVFMQIVDHAPAE